MSRSDEPAGLDAWCGDAFRAVGSFPWHMVTDDLIGANYDVAQSLRLKMANGCLDGVSEAARQNDVAVRRTPASGNGRFAAWTISSSSSSSTSARGGSGSLPVLPVRRASGRRSRRATSICFCRTRTCLARSSSGTKTPNTSRVCRRVHRRGTNLQENADQITEPAGIRRTRHPDAQARGLKWLLRDQRKALGSHPETRGRLIQLSKRAFRQG